MSLNNRRMTNIRCSAINWLLYIKINENFWQLRMGWLARVILCQTVDGAVWPNHIPEGVVYKRWNVGIVHCEYCTNSTHCKRRCSLLGPTGDSCISMKRLLLAAMTSAGNRQPLTGRTVKVSSFVRHAARAVCRAAYSQTRRIATSHIV